MEITKDKVTELFCIIDEFYKVFDAENAGKQYATISGVMPTKCSKALPQTEREQWDGVMGSSYIWLVMIEVR